MPPVSSSQSSGPSDIKPVVRPQVSVTPAPKAAGAPLDLSKAKVTPVIPGQVAALDLSKVKVESDPPPKMGVAPLDLSRAAQPSPRLAPNAIRLADKPIGVKSTVKVAPVTSEIRPVVKAAPAEPAATPVSVAVADITPEVEEVEVEVAPAKVEEVVAEVPAAEADILPEPIAEPVPVVTPEPAPISVSAPAPVAAANPAPVAVAPVIETAEGTVLGTPEPVVEVMSEPEPEPELESTGVEVFEAAPASNPVNNPAPVITRVVAPSADRGIVVPEAVTKPELPEVAPKPAVVEATTKPVLPATPPSRPTAAELKAELKAEVIDKLKQDQQDALIESMDNSLAEAITASPKGSKLVKVLSASVAVLGIAVGGLSLALYQAGQASHAVQAELRSENASLQSQLDDAALAAQDARAAQPSDSAGANNSTAVSATKPLILTEFGVKLVPEGSLGDLQYKATSSGGNTVIGFTTASLQEKYKTCTAGDALGYLSRNAKGSTPSADEVRVATVGNYSYYYAKPQTPCSTSAGAAAALSDAANALATTLKGLAAQ